MNPATAPSWPESLDRPALTIIPADPAPSPASVPSWPVIIAQLAEIRTSFAALERQLQSLDAIRTSFAAIQRELHRRAAIPRDSTQDDIRAVAAIKRAVAAKFELPADAFTSPCRRRSLAWPRQIAMYLCRELTDLSQQQIGGYFARDHTTVLSSCRAITNAITIDPKAERIVSDLITALHPLL